ncbi:transcription initiation factor TFIID subunit 8-like [Coffea eugenioides]|uniref:transcription initiation factor TFIID subunit 8-like n=1 Tax=Coffea eugenioides TaxID=49369 RepID=UPI000F60B7C0|nr:transcription initiation factor TFIID subunit 8-like [Coffea eugenioides]
MTCHPSESGLSATITRIAVAQISQSVGYSAAQTSALDTLANVAARYLGAVAHSAAASANSSGRTQSNIFDIVIALEELGSVQGFPNSSSQCLISSSILKEIRRFLFYSDEIPFAQPIPRQNQPVESRKSGNEMGLKHVPGWLPDMPVMDGMGIEKEGNEERNIGGGFVGEERNQSRTAKMGNGRGKGYQLPEKRGKVRFRMGMGGGNWGFGMERRNGVLNRGGIGKRILCESWSDGDGNEEEGNKKRVIKRSR